MMLHHRLRAVAKLSLKFVASAKSSTIPGQLNTLSLPGTVQAGDLVLLLSYAENNSSSVPTDSTPIGFTKLNTYSITYIYSSRTWSDRISIFYKIAGSGDAEATVTSFSGSYMQRHVAVVYRPSKAISAVTTGSFAALCEPKNTRTYTTSASSMVLPTVTLRVAIQAYSYSFSPTPTYLPYAADTDYQVGVSHINPSSLAVDQSITETGYGVLAACINIS